MSEMTATFTACLIRVKCGRSAAQAAPPTRWKARPPEAPVLRRDYSALRAYEHRSGRKGTSGSETPMNFRPERTHPARWLPAVLAAPLAASAATALLRPRRGLIEPDPVDASELFSTE